MVDGTKISVSKVTPSFTCEIWICYSEECTSLLQTYFGLFPEEDSLLTTHYFQNGTITQTNLDGTTVTPTPSDVLQRPPLLLTFSSFTKNSNAPAFLTSLGLRGPRW